MARFGIEEEFVLLDEQTLVPSGMSVEARDEILREVGPGLTAEYLTCQLESATAPVTTTEQARADLRRTRSRLGRAAAMHGAIVACSGTPFISPNRFVVSSSPHYDAVSAQLGEITREHEVNGVHVHVEVDGDEERVRVLNRIRAWLPTLLALTGNSPFTHGRDSGFASWRSILIHRLPSSWSPPHFEDLDDYRTRIDQLISMGAIADASSLSWTVRLSERFPTVEVRVFDAQLDSEDTLLAAALCRGIMTSDAFDAAAPMPLDVIDASLWTAARFGPDARLVDPLTGEVASVRRISAGLLDRLTPTLHRLGDAYLVAEGLARNETDGTGAQRQLRAYAENGTAGLRDHYLEGTATL